MSSYYINAKNKETGEEIRIAAIDDFFGKHHYGYIPEYEFGNPMPGTALTEEQFKQQYDRFN